MPALEFGTAATGPPVLLVPDIFGPSPFYEYLARLLAAQGLHVVLPDYFFRLGPLAQPDHGQAFERRRSLNEIQSVEDLRAAVAWLRGGNVFMLRYALARSGADSRVPEAIVARTLFRVREHGIGLAALLELLLRIGIVGIAVGMVLQRQLAVSALDLLVVRGARDAQDFVVVAFHTCGQK